MDSTPQAHYTKMHQAFDELLQFTNIKHLGERFTVYQPPSIHTILESLKEIDVTIQDKQPTLKEELKQFEEQSMTSNFYVQKVVQNLQTKSVKQESINCALLHIQSGFPSLKNQKERLKNCKLFSYKLAQQSENRQLNHAQQNVHLVQQLNKSNITKEFIIHMSIYHPFTHKKTQEIIVSQDSTLRSIIPAIQCSVEMTQQKFFLEENALFEEPNFNFGNLDDQIGSLNVQICKQYIFTHLNQCKHRIYIHEIRSLLEGEQTPLVQTIYKAPLKIRSCEGCGRSAEKFRVQDSVISGPGFWCEFCDKHLHNGVDNSLPYFCD